MNIAILRKPQESAVSYYRMVPLLELGRTDGHLVVQFDPPHFTVDNAHQFDVLFCHRPGNAEISAIATAKGLGVRVWLDLDDMLWGINYTNPAFGHYSPKQHDNMIRAMMAADVITCSTQALKKEIQDEFGRNAIVIPNAWNDRPGGDYICPFTPKNPPTILYRGSNTHDGDLYAHRSAFIPDVNFQFMGIMPWYFTKKYGGQLETMNIRPFTSDVLSYFRDIQLLNPQFFIFPLEDSRFNQCKSNIAWIEATMAGAVCIAPSYMPEFASVPCLFYGDEAHLKQLVQDIAFSGGCDQYKSIHTAAERVLRESFSLSAINENRRIIIETLTTKPINA